MPCFAAASPHRREICAPHSARDEQEIDGAPDSSSPGSGFVQGVRTSPAQVLCARSFMRKAIAIFFVLLCATTAFGQFADVSSAGGPVAIAAQWHFHTGDDPAWASPDFDDSQWPLLRIDKPWSEQGYKGYSGLAWYRIRVKLPATHEPLALAMSRIADADEIYVNGKLIGSDGQMRPKPVWRTAGLSLLNIPLAPGLQGQTIELAIRVWESSMEAPIAETGAASLPLLGTAQDVKKICRLSLDGSILSSLPFWIIDFVAGLIGLFSLALFLMRRQAREYAWAALFLSWSPAVGIELWLRHVYELNVPAGALATYYLIALGAIFWLLFVWSFVRARLDRLFVTGIAMSLLIMVSISLSVLDTISVSHFYALYAFARLSTGVIIFIKLVHLAWKGNRDAQLFILPFLLASVVETIQSVLSALYWAGAVREGRLILYHGDGLMVGWDEASLMLSYFAIGTVLVLRFTRSAREEQRLSTEMESAHQVQAQLVPLQLPAMPHFRFEAAYRPRVRSAATSIRSFLNLTGGAGSHRRRQRQGPEGRHARLASGRRTTFAGPGKSAAGPDPGSPQPAACRFLRRRLRHLLRRPGQREACWPLPTPATLLPIAMEWSSQPIPDSRSAWLAASLCGDLRFARTRRPAHFPLRRRRRSPQRNGRIVWFRAHYRHLNPIRRKHRPRCASLRTRRRHHRPRR